MSRIGATVGLSNLRRGGSGTQGAFDRIYTKKARQSMAGVISNYAKLVQYVRKIAPEVLEEALQPTFEKSQRYVPVDTGALKATGRILTTRKGRSFRTEISYGGDGLLHYASIVHELTHLQHKAPTRAKYLESALNEDLGFFKQRVVDAVRSRI